MTYKISNGYKKSIVETEIWTNDAGEELKHITVWRWGNWTTEGEPDLSDYDPEVGCDPYDLAEEIELGDMSDGDGDWEFPDSWDEEKRDEFLEAWDEEWHEAPEKFGFTEQDTEYWISGPLEVEKIS